MDPYIRIRQNYYDERFDLSQLSLIDRNVPDALKNWSMGKFDAFIIKGIASEDGSARNHMLSS